MASETEQLAGGYWANVTGNFIRAQLIKPFLGRPYLKLGQCFGLWGSLSRPRRASRVEASR